MECIMNGNDSNSSSEESDKFLIDNLLGCDDLDFDLDPSIWNEFADESKVNGILSCSSSNGSSDDDSFNNQLSPVETSMPMDTMSSSSSTSSTSSLFYNPYNFSETNLMSPQTQITPPGTPFTCERVSSPSSDFKSINMNTRNCIPTSVFSSDPLIISIPQQNLIPILPVTSSIVLSHVNRVDNRSTQQTPAIVANVKKENRNEMMLQPVVANDKLSQSLMKREARKVRNRESANFSRQKQKDRLDQLEDKVRNLSNENDLLREENTKLKDKLSSVEKENTYLRSKYLSPLSPKQGEFMNKKKATFSLLAVIFMLGFNLAPYTGTLLSSNEVKPILRTAHQESYKSTGRHILWENEKSDQLNTDTFELIDNIEYKKSALDKKKLNSSAEVDLNCHKYINKTESLRLQNDLMGWVMRVGKVKESSRRSFKRKQQAQQQTRNGSRKPMPLSRMKAWLQYHHDNKENEIELYNNKVDPVTYEDLLASIHRRDDTFYFVSFSAGDHLLLPAEANQTVIRPRFSIIMPAMSSINDTKTNGINSTYSQLTMMQIDCDVMNTKLVFVRNLVSNANRPADNKKANKTTHHRRKLI